MTLTDRGRSLLEAARRPGGDEPQQMFYAGIAKSRELAHDIRIYEAYRKATEHLSAHGSRIRQVVLDSELKREYQTFLQASNRGRRESSGRPQRGAEEIARWAHESSVAAGRRPRQVSRRAHRVRDARRTSSIEDVEVMTPHYRGRHAASKVRAGFTRYHAAGARIVGRTGPRRGGQARDPRLAEDMAP